MDVRLLWLVYLLLPLCDAMDETPKASKNEESLETKQRAESGKFRSVTGREKRYADADEEGEPKSRTTRIKEWFSKAVQRILGSGDAGQRGVGDDDAESGTGVVGRFLRWLLSLFVDSQRSVAYDRRGGNSGNGKPTGNEGKRWNMTIGENAEAMEPPSSLEVADWENGN